MTPPKHLWAGDWRRESNAAGSQRGEAVPPPPGLAPGPSGDEPPTEVQPVGPRRNTPPSRGAEPPRRGRKVFAVLAALFVVAVIAVGAVALLQNSDSGDSTTTNAALPAVSSAPIKPRQGQTRAAAIYAKVSPSVVSIRTSEGSGTAFLVDRNGTLVTNAHVVSTFPTVAVRFGTHAVSTQGKVLGIDQSSDLAVVKIDPSAVPANSEALKLADSRAVSIGDNVIAIGNPFGLDRTETTGIVSGTARDIKAPNGFQISEAIQTDAAINPGNSGGPLLNDAGDVIGVNSQIETGGPASNGNVGIGFAVPSNLVRQVVPALEKGEKIAHPWLGVSIGDPTTGSGALLGSITSGGPAEKAGLQQGDVVLSIAGAKVEDSADLARIVNAKRVGERVPMQVKRDGQTITITVTMGDRPALAPTTP